MQPRRKQGNGMTMSSALIGPSPMGFGGRRADMDFPRHGLSRIAVPTVADTAGI
jgi:hypothetical protein